MATNLLVLNIIDNLAMGGTQSLALRTMRHLDRLDVSVQCCVLGAEDRTYDWDWLPDRTIFLNHPADYRKPNHLVGLRSLLKKEIASSKPDLLHSWLWTSDFFTALANSSGKLPHLSHVVDRRTWLESSLLRHRLRRWMTQFAFRRSNTKFLAVSQSAREFAISNLKIPAQDIELVLNSIDVDDFSNSRESDFLSGRSKTLTLGMASRLAPEKGHSVMIDAMADLRKKGVDVKLMVTGSGSYLNELELQVKRLNLGDCIEFVGVVESVKAFLENIDFFLVPSVDSEGLPTSILEAMAAGRLVIASDIGGAKEAIADGQEGILVPARDSKSLAAAIADLSANQTKVREMTDAASVRVTTHFSMQSMTRQVAYKYEEMTR